MKKDNDYYNSLDKDSEEYRAYMKFNRGFKNNTKEGRCDNDIDSNKI